MAHSSNDRLDRIEVLVERIATNLQDERIRRTEDYNELRAWVVGFGERQEAANQGLRETVEELAQRQRESDQRFENLLADARADRQRSEERFRQSQAQADADRQQSEERFRQSQAQADADRQRIDEALARGDQDRALNEMEHRAFRETFQTLLAELSRIWQRLA